MKPTNPDPGELADRSISYIPDNGVCVSILLRYHYSISRPLSFTWLIFTSQSVTELFSDVMSIIIIIIIIIIIHSTEKGVQTKEIYLTRM